MIINYDLQKINSILQDFYNATGINMDLLKDDFTFVGNHRFYEKKKYCKEIQNTEAGKKACRCSDAELLHRSRKSKKTEMHICHAGLIDVSVPILYNDTIIGYVIFGQIKTDADFSVIRDYVVDLGLSEEEMKKNYAEITSYNAVVVQSISRIAEMLVKHILIENMLKPNFDESIQKSVNYINDNLDTDLTIQAISKHTNLSKSVLYRRFHSCFSCTVKQYINKRRIEKSLEFLSKGDLSIEEIAQRVGFTSGTYFSKIFKKEKGLSPLKFKKMYIKN